MIGNLKKQNFLFKKCILYAVKTQSDMLEYTCNTDLKRGKRQMKDILITGGTVFVSRYMAEYYVKKGHNVYVLNRGSREQSKGVVHIKADRHELGGTLKKYHFDAVIDVVAYNSEDIRHLLDALGGYDDYIMISSSAVYLYIPKTASSRLKRTAAQVRTNSGANTALTSLMPRRSY